MFITLKKYLQGIKHLLIKAVFWFQKGSLTVLQTIGIPMGIDPLPFSANSYILNTNEILWVS